MVSMGKTVGTRLRQLAGRLRAFSSPASGPPSGSILIFTGSATLSSWLVNGGSPSGILERFGRSIYVLPGEATGITSISTNGSTGAGAADFSNDVFNSSLLSINFANFGGLTSFNPTGLPQNQVTTFDLFNNALIFTNGSGGVIEILAYFQVNGAIALNLSGGTNAAVNSTAAGYANSIEEEGGTAYVTPDAPTDLFNAQAYSSTEILVQGTDSLAPNIGSYNARCSTNGGTTWQATITDFCAWGSLVNNNIPFTGSPVFTPNEAVTIQIQAVNSGGGNAVGPWSASLATYTGPVAPSGFTVINDGVDDYGSWTGAASTGWLWDTDTPPVANSTSENSFTTGEVSPGTTYYLAAEHLHGIYGDIASATSTLAPPEVACPDQADSSGSPGVVVFSGLTISGGIPPYASATVDPGDGSGPQSATIVGTTIVFTWTYLANLSGGTYTVVFYDHEGVEGTNTGNVDVSHLPSMSISSLVTQGYGSGFTTIFCLATSGYSIASLLLALFC